MKNWAVMFRPEVSRENTPFILHRTRSLCWKLAELNVSLTRGRRKDSTSVCLQRSCWCKDDQHKKLNKMYRVWFWSQNPLKLFCCVTSWPQIHGEHLGCDILWDRRREGAKINRSSLKNAARLFHFVKSRFCLSFHLFRPHPIFFKCFLKTSLWDRHTIFH